MENLKEHLEERLWNIIKRNYLSESYNNAILDSIQYLGDVIREKSGLDNDGNQLIGNAFGGNNPKIKINKLNTESDKNVQKGIESILRGIYSAYRNPRTHSSIEDSEVDAYEIIIFINHLLKIIDVSKGKFSAEIFLKRVFDNDFVPSQKYADLLIKGIPDNKFFEVAIEIFNKKNIGKIHNIQYVWNSIIKKLSKDELDEIFELVSEELRFTESLSSVTKCIALFKNDWLKIDEDARYRAEHKIIQTLERAEIGHNGKTNEYGSYASWLMRIVKKSLLKYEIANKLFEALDSGDEARQEFVLQFFGNYLNDLEDELIGVKYQDVFKQELKKGNIIIYNWILENKGEESDYKDELTSFVRYDPEDDLPF